MVGLRLTHHISSFGRWFDVQEGRLYPKLQIVRILLLRSLCRDVGRKGMERVGHEN